jgi:integrase
MTMGRTGNKLSVKFVERTNLKPGLYGDGNGLYLQVSEWETKAWVFRFMIAGRARKMGLGDVDRVRLADARRKAYEAHLLILDGIDPIDQRNERKAALAVNTAKATTFKRCAEGYITAHQHKWKSAKHGGQWATTLETYAYPVIGKLPVSAIEIAHIVKVLEPIWRDKAETARRVRSRLELVLDRASALKLRNGDNPARMTGELRELLGPQVKIIKHLEALPYEQLPALMRRLRGGNTIAARALEWTILTACRTGDTRGAVWSEIDMQKSEWTIPAGRLKGKLGKREKDHVVPLSDRAVAILKNLPREGEFIFAGSQEGKGLSDSVLIRLLEELGVASTVHGMRSTFRTWGAEQTNYPHEMLEMALAHVVGTAVERAYQRSDFREKRRKLMQDWSDFCGH